MTTIQTMTANGGTPLHCRHREHGACVTPTGKPKLACTSDVERSFDTSDTGRIWWDRDHAFGFPTAAALMTAVRAL